MVRVRVIRDKKVWHSAGPGKASEPQPAGAVIEVDEKQLVHLKGLVVMADGSALDASRSVPTVDTQEKSALPESARDPQQRMDAARTPEDLYSGSQKPGTPKK